MRSMTIVAALAAVCGGIGGASVSALVGERAVAQPTGTQGVRMATVDVLGVLERMLESELYRPARDEATAAWNDQLQSLGTERDALVQTLQTMDPQDPAAQQAYEQYQALGQRMYALQQEAQTAIDRFSAEQLADAYRKVYDAARAVAAREGFSHVFASRMSAEDIKAESTNVIVQEVLARPMLMSGEGEDLTALVVAELNIPETDPLPGVGPEPAEIPPAPGATEPGVSEPGGAGEPAGSGSDGSPGG